MAQYQVEARVIAIHQYSQFGRLKHCKLPSPGLVECSRSRVATDPVCRESKTPWNEGVAPPAPVTRNVRISHLYRCRHAGMGHIHPGQASCLGGRASCHLPGGKAWCQGFPEEMAWCHMVSEVQNTRSSKRVALHKTVHSTEVAPLIDLGKVHTGNKKRHGTGPPRSLS